MICVHGSASSSSSLRRARLSIAAHTRRSFSVIGRLMPFSAPLRARRKMRQSPFPLRSAIHRATRGCLASRALRARTMVRSRSPRASPTPSRSASISASDLPCHFWRCSKASFTLSSALRWAAVSSALGPLPPGMMGAACDYLSIVLLQRDDLGAGFARTVYKCTDALRRCTQRIVEQVRVPCGGRCLGMAEQPADDH
jgi:hypothetical protein